jgi:hypothetical protein
MPETITDPPSPVGDPLFFDEETLNINSLILIPLRLPRAA